MQSDPDGGLVAAAAGGDAEAFAALVTRHQAAIVNLARAMTADDGEADDLAQETFIRAYKSIGRFRGDSTFRTWLHRVAVNVIQSHLRTRARRWRWFGPSLDEPAMAGKENAALATASTLEDYTARRQAIDRALATLPPDMRLVVTL